MPRIPKSNINTPFLHIMIQGNNKQFILEKTEDKQKYIKILKDTKEEINTTILSYCIMGNHSHLLFYDKNINNVIKFMHKSNLLYAKYYNNKYDRVGYVFRDRYKTQPIMSERQLLTCINYIHNNPVKADICKTPSDYKYSSYNTNVFLGNSQLEMNIKKYINERKNIQCDKEFELMEYETETKEEMCSNKIKEFLKINNLTIYELKDNSEYLAKMVKYLHEKNSISYRTIGKVININHEKVRRIMEEYKNKL